MNFNRPMLASDVELSKIKYPVICMPKIDGVRAVNPYGNICARSFKPFRNTKINDVYNNPDFIGFDGEFVVGSPTDKDCCRITTSNVSSKSSSVSPAKPAIISLPINGNSNVELILSIKLR